MLIILLTCKSSWWLSAWPSPVFHHYLSWNQGTNQTQYPSNTTESIWLHWHKGTLFSLPFSSTPSFFYTQHLCQSYHSLLALWELSLSQHNFTLLTLLNVMQFLRPSLPAWWITDVHKCRWKLRQLSGHFICTFDLKAWRKKCGPSALFLFSILLPYILTLLLSKL